MGNSSVDSYEALLRGLKQYRASLTENSATLRNSVRAYDEGINDKSSHVTKKKVDKICDIIDKTIIERVEKLEKFVGNELDQLEEMEKQLNSEDSFARRRERFTEALKVEVASQPIRDQSSVSLSEDAYKEERQRSIFSLEK